MLLSFIIPLYNCLALTRACVESLQATVHRRFEHEIILIDDGSTDGTREWLATLGAPFRVILNERNFGYAFANNRAAAAARGKFLVLLNNDLILMPEWLDLLLNAHRSLRKRAGIIGNVQLDARTGEVDHAGIIINRQGKPVHDRTYPWLGSRMICDVRRVPAVTGACLLIERALWNRLGGFDAGFVNGGEDVDLCFRARTDGHDTAVALHSVVRHHISSSAGRKLHDERNSYRLASRWHRAFVAAARHATRDWCREYLEATLPDPHFTAHRLGRHALFHALYLTPTPPPEAVASIEAAQAREFAQWEKMFGA